MQNIPLVLLILDGFGIAPPSRGNAISQAKMPVFNDLLSKHKAFSLAASGEAVGLPWGEPGNSEVGHLNLGAGKIVYQEVLSINNSIENGSFFENQAFLEAISHCKKHNSSLHLAGLVSDGGVHSHQDHLLALLELAGKASLKRVFVHVFLDGRDTAFNSGLGYVRELERIMKRIGVGSIATVSGRFWAMDRDNHWDRIEKTYKAMVRAESDYVYDSAIKAITESYERKVYDEEFFPTVINSAEKKGISRIQPGDSLIFFNYRPDRAREITKSFVLPAFTKFERSVLSNLCVVTLTEYESNIPVKVAYRKDAVSNPIARVLSDSGLTQLHIAETEKYAHVTYFFNGGKDTVFPGQDNMIIPSVNTSRYDESPAMSIREITKHVVNQIVSQKYHFYVINFANADMVGHTGNLKATKIALEHIDQAILKIYKATASNGGVLAMTSDHGNSEEMINWENGHIVKQHSANPVPFIVVGDSFKLVKQRNKLFDLNTLKISGVLSDVSPALLSVLGIPAPKEMTSRSFL